MNDTEIVLLIDKRKDEASIDTHHKSETMK